jgi:hypothetical protein
MAVFSRLVTLFAISSFVLVASPVAAEDSSALASNQRVRARASHHNFAKRSFEKRAAAKAKRGKCKPREPSTTSTTKTSTSIPAPASTGSLSGSKVGLAWNNPDPNMMWQFVGDGKATSWHYTWSPWNAKPSGLKIDWCPMMWGAKQEGQWNENLANVQKAKCALGMNEPERNDQGSISPWDAAALWKRTIGKLDSSVVTVSPSPTNSDAGFTWLSNFLKACDGCKVDAIGAHYYGKDPKLMQNHLNRVHDTFGKNVWVTEFACMDFGTFTPCTKDEAWYFNDQMLKWMNSKSWVTRYAAFGALVDMYNVGESARLMTRGGALTSLGWEYIKIR